MPASSVSNVPGHIGLYRIQLEIPWNPVFVVYLYPCLNELTAVTDHLFHVELYLGVR